MALSDLTGNKNEMKEIWEPMYNEPCSSLPRFWVFLWIILGPIYLLIHGLMKRPLQIFAWQIKNNIYLLRKDLWSFDQSSFSFSIMQISKVFKFHSVNLHWNSFSKNCFKWNSWNLVKDARKVIFDLRFWCIFSSLNIGLL